MAGARLGIGADTGADTGAARSLFVATIFAGSFLLFLVQPMVARMALPRLGGAPNVWNSAMLVYQALLLAGYAYAHALARQPVRRQAWIHLALLAAFALTLPLALYRLPPAVPGWEVLWVPLLLLLTVGPVFLVLSAQAPLMQRWYIADPLAREPWALYAASNLASFAGLIAYPLVVEPLLPLGRQSQIWSAGYGVVFALVLACAWQRRHSEQGPARPADHKDAAARPPGLRRIALWLALSAVPSGLMLSTTTHLTTDIFAMPLLWVIPLGLYLLSFVIAFSDRRLPARVIVFVAPAVMLMAGGLTMISRSNVGMALALASVLLLFVVAVALHARLYDSRPDAGHLTGFYLAMSVGGALGGTFTALAAPVLFDWVWEHPLLVLAAALLMPLPAALDWRGLPGLEPGMMRLGGGIVLGVAAFVAWQLYDLSPDTDGLFTWLVMTGALTAVGLLLVPWRLLFAAVLFMMMLVQGGVDTIEGTLEGQRLRSYFGVYTVIERPQQQLRLLVHGTTLHGQQSTDPARRRETMTYYGPGSGAALAIEQAPALFGRQARIGVVGLGTGTLACLREPGERWTFFELDPAVVALSRDGTFTYLRDCAPDAPIVLGDARLELEKAAPGRFDMLAIDAFSSDAIPLHLLTTEAIDVYMRSLSEDGVLLIHISNRYIMLEPVIAALARRHGLAARIRTDNPQDRSIYTPSAWVALSRKASQLRELERPRPDAPWDDLAWPASQVWSDERATILPYIQWDKLLGDL